MKIELDLAEAAYLIKLLKALNENNPADNEEAATIITKIRNAAGANLMEHGQ
jgi:membrane carboxypeptidase/penicillin-binding protein